MVSESKGMHTTYVQQHIVHVQLVKALSCIVWLQAPTR